MWKRIWGGKKREKKKKKGNRMDKNSKTALNEWRKGEKKMLGYDVRKENRIRGIWKKRKKTTGGDTE